MSRTCGYRSLSICGVPSVDPLSTTAISKRCRRPAPNSESRHGARSRLLLQHTITTDKSGAAESFQSVCTGAVVEVCNRFVGAQVRVRASGDLDAPYPK